MIIVTPITDWQTTTVSRGRGMGNQIVSRYVLAADLWNLVVAVERKDSLNIAGEAFFGNFKTLLPWLNNNGIHDALPKIVAELCKRTGKPDPKITSLLPFEQGRVLDDYFECSYMREYPPMVLKRVFKSEDKETVAAA